VKLIEHIRRRIARLLSSPVDELGSWARLLRSQIQLWRFCARRLRENNAMAMSAALSFRTIFALVPVLILGFLVVKSLGIVADKKRLFGDFMRESGLAQIAYVEDARSQPPSDTDTEDRGASQEISLADKIQSVMDRVESQLTIGRLGPIGAALLIWAAITLLTTVESCLNRIFEAPASRPLGRRILLYWSAVTLGPLALIGASYLGDLVLSLVRYLPVLGVVTLGLNRAWPVIVGVLLLGLLYRLLPNTHVRRRAALGGAATTVVLWLIARWGFALYVRHVGRQSIYGAMGLVPLFLMWLNISWLIFLFGAELAHTAANLSRLQLTEQSRSRILSQWDLLAVLLIVARANIAGERPIRIEQISGKLGLPDDATENLLSRLCEEGLIARGTGDEGQTYLLARSAHRMKVSDVLKIGSAYVGAGTAGQCAAEIAGSIGQIRSKAHANIEELTVEQLVRQT